MLFCVVLKCYAVLAMVTALYCGSCVSGLCLCVVCIDGVRMLCHLLFGTMT